jgi:hypothetical protein
MFSHIRQNFVAEMKKGISRKFFLNFFPFKSNQNISNSSRRTLCPQTNEHVGKI